MSTGTTEVRRRVEELIENGSRYRVEALEDIYHRDLRIVKIDETGTVTVIDRDENLAFFAAKRDRGDRPLGTAAAFNHVEADGGTGHVIVTRHMQLGARPERSVFAIDLVHEDGRWQVLRETAFVQPLPSRTGREED